MSGASRDESSLSRVLQVDLHAVRYAAEGDMIVDFTLLVLGVASEGRLRTSSNASNHTPRKGP